MNNISTVNVRDFSLTELDTALTEVQQQRRTALREGEPPDIVVALENTMVKLTNELRRRGL